MAPHLKTNLPVNHLDTVAAVDLGSNSFHMIVVQPNNDEFKIIDRLREPVHLSADLAMTKQLSPETQARALACLQRFGQRLQPLPHSHVRAVGTNALRSAHHAKQFLTAAQHALGHPIGIISGIEEARLIYLGVNHSLANDTNTRLVIDIGGGSTEMIIGEGTAPRYMESLSMGCVSLSRQFFPNGYITDHAMHRAEIAARTELAPIHHLFRRSNWERAIGTSGTIRAIFNTVKQAGWSHSGITYHSLQQLVTRLIELGHVDALTIKGLSKDRASVLPGGVAILFGAFKAFGIEQIEVADGALREGLIIDLLGRMYHKDIRHTSVSNLAHRYHINQAHADQVKHTAIACLTQVANIWPLTSPHFTQWLAWACTLHEIGLAVAHKHYHKHGAYIIKHADLSGFSHQEQLLLSVLVRTHRRKFSKSVFKELPQEQQGLAQYLAILLRLSVIIHRSHSEASMPALALTADKHTLQLKFPDDWLAQHPLTDADLAQETTYLAAANFTLQYQ